MTDKSEVEFEAEWAKTVATEFKLDEAEILSLWSDADGKTGGHMSNWRVREFWKYGASIGISATPMAYVNGVKLDGYPTN